MADYVPPPSPPPYTPPAPPPNYSPTPIPGSYPQGMYTYTGYSFGAFGGFGVMGLATLFGNTPPSSQRPILSFPQNPDGFGRWGNDLSSIINSIAAGGGSGVSLPQQPVTGPQIYNPGGGSSLPGTSVTPGTPPPGSARPPSQPPPSQPPPGNSQPPSNPPSSVPPGWQGIFGIGGPGGANLGLPPGASVVNGPANVPPNIPATNRIIVPPNFMYPNGLVFYWPPGTTVTPQMVAAWLAQYNLNPQGRPNFRPPGSRAPRGQPLPQPGLWSRFLPPWLANTLQIVPPLINALQPLLPRPPAVPQGPPIVPGNFGVGGGGGLGGGGAPQIPVGQNQLPPALNPQQPLQQLRPQGDTLVLPPNFIPNPNGPGVIRVPPGSQTPGPLPLGPNQRFIPGLGVIDL